MEFAHPFPNKSPGDEITKQELITAVRLALCAEEEATQLYDTIAEYASDENVKKIMKDVADEEQVHIGEFQKLLNMIEDDEAEKTKEGEKEAEDKLSGELEEGVIMDNSYEVTEDVAIVLDGEKYLLEAGDHIRIVTEDEDSWPEDVEKGGLRKLMGLDADKSLEDQTSPTAVAEFFQKADKGGRGKVMFAVNSNKDSEFWKKVGDMVHEKSKEKSED